MNIFIILIICFIIYAICAVTGYCLIYPLIKNYYKYILSSDKEVNEAMSGYLWPIGLLILIISFIILMCILLHKKITKPFIDIHIKFNNFLNRKKYYYNDINHSKCTYRHTEMRD